MAEVQAISNSASLQGFSGRSTELEELLHSFNDAAGRLQATQEGLQNQVAKLEDELRETRARLQRSERLAALGEMAAGIAHEIRNPLGSIRLYARALEEDLVERPAECEIATKIGRAVVGLDRVVGDVLAFSRQIDARVSLCDSSDIFAHALDACAESLQSAGVVAEVCSDSIMLDCDHELAHRALVNVVRNAAEAMEETESAVRRVALAAVSTDLLGSDGLRVPAIALRVVDTGPGVPSDVRDRMFNPFFTTRRAGTGLGLAIVQRIMDAHDGAVTVSNNADPKEDAGNAKVAGAIVELCFPSAATSAPKGVGQGG